MTVTVTPEHRDRLTRIRGRTHRARDAMAHARQVLDVARRQGDEDAVAVAEGQLEAARIESDLAGQLEVQMLEAMTGMDGGYGAESVFDNPETIRTLQALAHSTFPIGNIPLGPLCSREEFVQRINSGAWDQPKMAAGSSTPDIPGSARLGPWYGIVPQLRRPLRLLDLIPTRPMEGESFGYVRRSNTNQAAETAEGALKPGADVTMTDAQVVAKTIPEWVKLKRQQLADVPGLATDQTDMLVKDCLERLEGQIVAGDGTGENLTGILSTSGIGDVQFAAGTALSDLVLRGRTVVRLSKARADAVVLNPVDLETMLIAKASTSGVRLDSDGAFGNDPTTIWGLLAVDSEVLPQGQALVGAFSTCATIYIRETVNLRISESDQDDFLRNMVTYRAEMRAGLAVWQPGGFALVHLA